MNRFLFLAACFWPLTATAYQSPEPPPEIPGAVIKSIRVERTNVFDPAVPGEDLWLFQIANKLHYPTRESAIRRELLFSTEEFWDPLKVIQSERNLRANGSFRHAEIIPKPHPDGTVDAVVYTQDSWTTNPRFSVGTEGGENFFGLGIEEGNLLGSNRTIGFDHNRTGRNTADTFHYGDPRFMGTRLALAGSYTKGNRGDSGAAALTRPFYALDAQQAMAASWNHFLVDASLYADGDERSRFRLRRRTAEASLGSLVRTGPNLVQRAEGGWYSDSVRFTSLPETAGPLPFNRDVSGPTLGYSWVQPRYVKETYIDRMERIEDFNLGNEFSFRGGWMSEATGSDRDRLIFNASQQQGLQLMPGRFVIGRISARGRLARGKYDNAILSAGLSWFWKTNLRGDHTLVAHLETVRGRNLDRENQVTLGGGSGLRGYKNNSFTGAKAVLLNFEDRFFWDREWFHLARLGAAVFSDTGVVAADQTPLTWRYVKSDVGVGLRVASTRSRSGGVARIDLAYALNRGPGPSRWVLSIRGGQAFSLINSASARVDSSPASQLN